MRNYYLGIPITPVAVDSPAYLVIYYRPTGQKRFMIALMTKVGYTSKPLRTKAAACSTSLLCTGENTTAFL